MNKELTLALVLVLVSAVATAAMFATTMDASAKSNKDFGKCVSAAKGNNTAKEGCNSLKRGHPFNFTSGSD